MREPIHWSQCVVHFSLPKQIILFVNTTESVVLIILFVSFILLW